MKNVLLIGLGRFGMHVAAHLYDLGHQVMAVDTDEDRVNKVLPYVTNAQIGDSTDADFLRSLGVDNYDVCIVTIGGNFQNSLETASLLEELGAKKVPTRLFIPKSRLLNGPPSVTLQIIFSIISRSTTATASSRSMFLPHGSVRA